jgi:ceramide glucosyltransferase
LRARSPLAWMARDLLLPVIWLNGMIGNAFVWRGNQMRTAESRGAV